VQLVGCTIEIYHEARHYKSQIYKTLLRMYYLSDQ